ncbi:hypothetical protein PSm6_44500 [Pseudomonas solani]|uniref:Uncharacterized protein n=1 Tax=Pseudomonas solani TaxID=2731552 RepID=A0ABM7LEH2_9PSED|nr:hypothetical protein PSm6_44500 [Pseudomonas solani]
MKSKRISISQLIGSDVPKRIRDGGYDSMFCVFVGRKLEAAFVNLEELNKYMPHIEGEAALVVH